MKSIEDFKLEGKRVLIRSSLNVPMANGEIQDDLRLQESIATIRYVVEKGGFALIMGHLGRPEPVFDQGKQIPQESSLESIAKHLERLLGENIRFLQDPIGKGLEQQVSRGKPGEAQLLENIRFYKGETENNTEFARQLASLADIYVNDAFAVCHRVHASIVGVPAFLPSAAGLLLEKELHMLGQMRDNPEKPMVAVVGGSKVETKAKFLQHISEHASVIPLGNLLSKQVKEKGLEIAEGAELVYATDGQ